MLSKKIKKQGIIYAIAVNNKKYIGSTTQHILTRVGQHVYFSRYAANQNNKFYSELRSNLDNFSYEIQEEKIPVNKLKFCEDKWIRKLNTIDEGLNSIRAFVPPDQLRHNTNIANLLNYYAKREQRLAYQLQYKREHPEIYRKNSKNYYERHLKKN